MSKKQIKQWIARKIFTNDLEKCLQIVIDSFSKDEYGQGFYNGLEFAISSMLGQEPDYLNLEEYRNKK